MTVAIDHGGSEHTDILKKDPNTTLSQVIKSYSLLPLLGTALLIILDKPDTEHKKFQQRGVKRNATSNMNSQIKNTPGTKQISTKKTPSERLVGV